MPSLTHPRRLGKLHVMPAMLLALAVLLCLSARAGGAMDARLFKVDQHAAASNPARMNFERVEAVSADHRPLGSIILPAIVRGPAWDGKRPLIVVFNGGPGAASGWLQLGLLGPLLADIPDDPAAQVPRHPRLIANRNGLWDIADMLFVDPLGTGFSRAAPGVPDASIHDWRNDGQYIARVVRDWMIRHHRLAQPIMLMGESYGTERAVAVADALTTGPDPLHLSGFVLISQSIFTANSLRSQGNDLGIALGLPTMAATACYFGRGGLAGVPPQACAERARAFALADYLPALDAGRQLGARRRAALVVRLARLTGLPPTTYAGPGFALSTDRYLHLALADRRMVLGAHDSRYVAPDDPARPWQDPSLDDVLPAMTDAAQRANGMMLGLDRSPLDRSPYVLFDGRIPSQWRYGQRADPHKSLVMKGMLGRTLRRTGARLMIAGGLFDAAGGYGADRYLATHLDLPPARIELGSYPGGHMFYLNSTGRTAFLHSLRRFVESAGVTG